MSTTEVTTWVTNLSDIGPIYPLVGWEVLMFILGLIFWIAFHVWQIRTENQIYEEDLARLQRPEDVEHALRTQTLNND